LFFCRGITETLPAKHSWAFIVIICTGLKSKEDKNEKEIFLTTPAVGALARRGGPLQRWLHFDKCRRSLFRYHSTHQITETLITDALH